MKSNRKALLGIAAALLVSAGEAWGQAVAQAADCQLFFNFTAAGQVAGPIANYGAGSVNGANLCDTWTIAYTVVGFSGVSLRFESANAATATTPGTFGAYAGTVNVGVNPNTSTTGAQSKFTNGAVAIPWVQVKLTTATGSGNVVGMLQGWNSGNGGSAGSGPGGGGGSGCPNPCPVIGTAAAGTPPSGAPVQVGGQDGTNIQTIKTDTTGRIVNNPLGATAAQADGASNSPTVPQANATAATNLVYDFKFNGSTWDRDYSCTNQQAFTIAAGTDVVIVTGVASQITRLCHVSFANDSAQTYTFRQGTGTTCLTNTLALSGAYGASINGAFDFGPYASLRTTIAARDMCLHFGASVTGGGVAIYATF